MSNVALQATRMEPPENSVGVDSMLLGVFVSLLVLGLVMVFSSTIAMGSQTLQTNTCLLYTSPSPRDLSTSRMPSSA